LERTGLDENAEDDTGVVSWPLDLSTFDSVRAFADRFAAEALLDTQLNVFVANAGVYVQDYTETTDGWELMCVSILLHSCWKFTVGALGFK